MNANLLVTIYYVLVDIVEVTIGIGLIGHVLTLIVLSRKTFRNTSMSVYCRALAVTDCFTLVYLVFTILVVHFNVNLVVNSNAACKFCYYVIMSMSPMSDWLLAAFSFDNMLSVLNVQTLAFLNRPKSRLIIVAVIVVFNACLYVSIPLSLDIVTFTVNNVTSVKCDLFYLNSGKALLYTYVVESSFLPFVIMIVTTVVIVKCLRDSRHRLHKSLSQRTNARKVRELKYALSAIVFNVLFIIFKTPMSYYYLVTIKDYVTNAFFLVVSIFTYYFNYSSRFLFHLMSNSIFRREFMIMMGYQKSAHPSAATFNHKFKPNKAISTLTK